MSRHIKFNTCAPSVEVMDCNSDMVEINLNASCGKTAELQQSAVTLDKLLKLKLPLHRGYPYGYSDVEDALPQPYDAELYFCKKSNSTGELADKVAGGKMEPPADSISCLRQMYCPECQERLHEQGVRLERLLALCCFPLLPIYPCCMKPQKYNDECKVICRKCGYLLGAWKRQ